MHCYAVFLHCIIGDVQDEIFDMVRPADPLKITLEELKASKQGHTILFMLVDCNAFYQYDNVSTLCSHPSAVGMWC